MTISHPTHDGEASIRLLRGGSAPSAAAHQRVVPTEPEQHDHRTATLQAMCGFGVIPATRRRTGPSTCGQARPDGHGLAAPRQFLVSGGFQRTDFRSDGGDYITESHASGTNAWVVSATPTAPAPASSSPSPTAPG